MKPLMILPPLVFLALAALFFFGMNREGADQLESTREGGPVPPMTVESFPGEEGFTIETLADRTRYLVPSHDPADTRFDAKRYWRGPVWLVCNYLIVDGLSAAGETAVADRIVASSLELIEESGFAEYYDPITGEACGGGRFTWTAAMVLEFLDWA